MTAKFFNRGIDMRIFWVSISLVTALILFNASRETLGTFGIFMLGYGVSEVTNFVFCKEKCAVVKENQQDNR